MKAAAAVKQLMERPYKLGAQDCYTFIREFYQMQGIEIPTQFKYLNLDNYVEVWESGGGRETFSEGLQTLGKEVNINYMREGDLILIEVEDTAYPCIYLGFDKVLIVSIETGSIVMPFWSIKHKVISVRRLDNG